MISAYEHGGNAARHGKHIRACPFDSGTTQWREWRSGFIAGVVWSRSNTFTPTYPDPLRAPRFTLQPTRAPTKGGAHHLSRRLKALGHDARLMPAKYVRPYSKGQTIAAVGPVVAHVSIGPSDSFHMKPMVNEIVAAFDSSVSK